MMAKTDVRRVLPLSLSDKRTKGDLPRIARLYDVVGEREAREAFREGRRGTIGRALRPEAFIRSLGTKYRAARREK